MRVSAALRSRVLLALVAVASASFTVTGCGAGWGSQKPSVGSASGQSASQSKSQTVLAGQSATFSVTPSGTGPFAYQWYLNGVAIPGANGSSYTTPPTTGGDNGDVYTVTITNAAGSATGGPYILTVNAPPAITVQPQSQSIVAGQAAMFTVTATGTAPLSYQWYDNGAPIAGATNSSYTTPATGIGDSGSSFTATVKNPYGAATSSAATLTVSPLTPVLNFAPIASQTYGTAPFSVSATSASNGAVTYSVVSGPAMIAGNVVTLTGVGKVVLSASQVAAGNYTAATTTTSFAVGGEVPTLSFSPIPSKTDGSAPFPVSASSASTGAITYTVVSGPATISGNVVTLTGTGTVELMASQAATGDYAAATAITTFTVAGETPTITFPSPGTLPYSAQPFAVNATSNSTGAITYTVVSGPATISGNMVTMTGAGAVQLMASQAATGSFGTGTATTTFTITATAPTITLQPVSENICSNQSFTLAVNAANATAYQWYLNGNMIPGANSSTYSVSDATASNTGDYTVAVSNPTESVTSGVATVHVGSTIVTNPSNLTITQYQEGSFNVAATGSGHYTYQWYSVPFGGTPSAIPGATSDLYVTPAQTTVTTSGEPTGYYATVADTTCNGTLTSGTGYLTVTAGNSPPTITTQPVGQTVTAGSGATFTAAAVGSPTVTYQWYVIPNGGTNQEIAGTTPQTGQLISGATSASYTVPAGSTGLSNDQDIYYMVATNSYGSAVSQYATLAVDQGIQLQITDEPVNQYVNPGEPATFSVTATSTAPLTYQWYMVPPGESAAAQTTYTLVNGTATSTTSTANAVAIQGATEPSYTVTNPSAGQSGTVYYVLVSNGSTSSVYSNTASLTVGQPSSITLCATNWNMLGTTTAGDCSYELTNGQGGELGEIVWPTLISTGNVQLSFTITTSNTSPTPADGFAMVLGDPSLGAVLNSVGLPGEGLGAKGIPGFVLAFDDFFNPACTGSGCFPAPYPADPSSSGDPDYLGVGRGEPVLWENPYFNVNTNLPGGADALAWYGHTVTHAYVVTIANGYMSVTIDGTQVFSGNVTVPPVAYLYMTSSTGGSYEETVISQISATVNAPSN